MKKPVRDLKRPVTVGDLDDLGTQIITAISNTLQDYPTKEDLKHEVGKVEQKVDTLEKKVDGLDKKVDKLSYDVSDIRRRVIDLEVDTVPRKDFQDLKYLVATHRHS
ncbi:hypothetical protein HY032_03775 [Candidatus Gottesmanbacteria bacterium]|nr:hypothetical protein [Candidatus Gottesmanbacteria bacterium]